MTDQKTCEQCGAFMNVWEGPKCDTCDPFVPLCDYRHDEGEPPADWFLQGESGEFYVCDEHFQMRTEEGKRGWVPWEQCNCYDTDEELDMRDCRVHDTEDGPW